MTLYKTKWFARFARKERLSDRSLRDAIERVTLGMIDADLGGGLIKQRLARDGQGRSGGYRMLVAFRKHERAVFHYGFANNERDNIKPDELASLQELAAAWLSADGSRIKAAIEAKELQEVEDGETRN